MSGKLRQMVANCEQIGEKEGITCRLSCKCYARFAHGIRGQCGDEGEIPSGRAALFAFQAARRKTIIAESSIHTIKPIAAAGPPNTSPYFIFATASLNDSANG
jgi:hypothetical protein